MNFHDKTIFINKLVLKILFSFIFYDYNNIN